ncbi:ssDNA binding protein [Enterobacteria phage PR4]|uniref:SsDNA binding protein n=1 Tax=Enterobacteria phage PR4 TaxID=318595 RepID=Q3T4V8_9VIRU|nr:single strand DNA binding protein [Enterobacteria phage PR4]AAX45597.1 ssDNA binding protein [Enterobacteria phage PR4]
MEIVSKLTLKTIGAQPKPHSVKENTALASIYGRVRGKKVGQSTFGDFIKFEGEFEGVNIATGEVFRSGALILPKVLESLLAGAVDGENTVDFAVEIWAKPSEKGNTGYEYGVKPLIEPAASDELAALRNQVKAALPAPAAGEAAAEAKPAAKAKAKAEA